MVCEDVVCAVDCSGLAHRMWDLDVIQESGHGFAPEAMAGVKVQHCRAHHVNALVLLGDGGEEVVEWE